MQIHSFSGGGTLRNESQSEIFALKYKEFNFALQNCALLDF